MRLGNFVAATSLSWIDRLGLREQLLHRLLAGAGHRLIGRDHDALDRRLVVQRLERDDELRGRAVRVGDDALLAEARDRVGVHLRHDQRHVRVVAPGRRVIDHHRAGGGDLRRPFLRHRSARRHQADVGVGEIVVVERFGLERLVAVGHFLPEALARCERDHLVGGEFPLGEDVHHLAAHIAGGAYDGDLVAHDRVPALVTRFGLSRPALGLVPISRRERVARGASVSASCRFWRPAFSVPVWSSVEP